MVIAEMRSACVILLAALLAVAVAGCPSGLEGPLPPDKLAAYQACGAVEECALAFNAPLSCCGAIGLEHWVAIARERAGVFREQFAEPSCSGAYDCVPATPEAVLENRFELACTNGQCAI